MKAPWQTVIETAAAEAGCSPETARKAYWFIKWTMVRTTRINQDYEMNGLGTVSVGRRAARMGRNPRNGAVIRIPSKKYPFLKIAPTLKNRLKAAGFA
jgi:DNA-binding protein HU-beta